MVQDLFHGLVEAIETVAGKDDMRPIHFYMWSQRDMSHLIDACTRAGGSLLHNLTELLGCREECQGDLEQLIFTPLSDEIDRKMALGYTGRGLAMVTSLSWFGFPRFDWTRSVSGKSVDLSQVFRRDIFDFRTVLYLDARNEWCRKDDPEARRENFEIRARFGSGPSAHLIGTRCGGSYRMEKVQVSVLRSAVEDYRNAGTRELITSFLECKCQALRWVEERFFKDPKYHQAAHPGRGASRDGCPFHRSL